MEATIEISQQAARDELRRMLTGARAPEYRSMLEFAEQEIVLPTGPFAGRRFRTIRQPYTRLFFNEVDSARWRRIVTTGPSQSGKTLVCFVIPLLYHLFELGESIILGLPDMNMAQDKWDDDMLPVIEASRYKSFLPVRGEGSRGGAIKRAVNFENGTTLRFMSGGGGDKQRAAKTTRVLIITETDGMDFTGGASREADKISQLEARTEAYGDAGRVYMECTVSTEQGRTWREYIASTHSRIMLPCPRCGEWVSPEREDFKGWQNAATIIEAREKAAFHCTHCSAAWTDDDRRQANEYARLVHAGQEINSSGDIEGEPPATDTLGFRWSAVNNLLATSAHLGAKEWRARHDPDEENSDTALRQFTWALPAKPPEIDLSQISAPTILTRTTQHERGRIPPGVTHIACGVDLGKWLCHWMLAGFEPDATMHVFDYGVLEVQSSQMAEELALLLALREFRDRLQTRYERVPDLTLIDSGWHPDAAYAFAQESGETFMASKGYGVGQQRTRAYIAPRTTGSTIARIGDHYHISRLKSPRVKLVEIDVDYWKAWLHSRIRTPMANPGAFKLFAVPNTNDHLSIAKHLVSERQKHDPRAKGMQIVFEQVHHNNHWLDAGTLASVAGHMTGIRLMTASEASPAHTTAMRPPAPTQHRSRGAVTDIGEDDPVEQDNRDGGGGWFAQQRRGRSGTSGGRR